MVKNLSIRPAVIFCRLTKKLASCKSALLLADEAEQNGDVFMGMESK